ncbi:MAG: hypothetical protein KGI50_06115 [Patescibacteria group bacterium]|nr:hypothetical protein [Patescibacteria group bacterium]MDE2439083.1 hypothetical protein [Patescibacteria group bacterium]
MVVLGEIVAIVILTAVALGLALLLRFIDETRKSMGTVARILEDLDGRITKLESK